jgi:hypothetical protein
MLSVIAFPALYQFGAALVCIAFGLALLLLLAFACRSANREPSIFDTPEFREAKARSEREFIAHETHEGQIDQRVIDAQKEKDAS